MKDKEQEKNVRTSKVQYSSRPTHEGTGVFRKSGYTYFPRISIAGLWLEELGFHVGDKLQVEYGDKLQVEYGEGYLHISRMDVSMVCEQSNYTDAVETQEPGKTTRKKRGQKV